MLHFQVAGGVSACLFLKPEQCSQVVWYASLVRALREEHLFVEKALGIALFTFLQGISGTLPVGVHAPHQRMTSHLLPISNSMYPVLYQRVLSNVH